MLNSIKLQRTLRLRNYRPLLPKFQIAICEPARIWCLGRDRRWEQKQLLDRPRYRNRLLFNNHSLGNLQLVSSLIKQQRHSNILKLQMFQTKITKRLIRLRCLIMKNYIFKNIGRCLNSLPQSVEIFPWLKKSVLL